MTPPLIKDRSLPSRCPGATHQRCQEQSALVEEDQVSVQPPRFFLMRGQSAFAQRRMACSSRSRARRSGFWGLQPIARSNRPMWSTWYRTPNSRRITLATRGHVHRSVAKPLASGPRISKRSSLDRAFASSFGGRPDVGRAARPSRPAASCDARQRRTERRSTPSRRATSTGVNPSWSNATARTRRFSSCAGLPEGRMTTSRTRV